MPPCILHSLNLPNFGSLGPSGAGKTTLLEILATILLPTRGEVRVCGYDVVRQAVPVRKIVGYCPSTTESFYPGLTGWENPEFFGLLNGLPLGKAKQKIAWAMNLVGMDGTRAVPFQRLSQGMKQRLALAHALEGTRALVLGGGLSGREAPVAGCVQPGEPSGKPPGIRQGSAVDPSQRHSQSLLENRMRSDLTPENRLCLLLGQQHLTQSAREDPLRLLARSLHWDWIHGRGGNAPNDRIRGLHQQQRW